MNADNRARNALIALVQRAGHDIGQDQERCENELNEACGGLYRTEIAQLAAAIGAGVPANLQRLWSDVPLGLLIARLWRQLVDELRLTPERARWVVISWGVALGRITPTEGAYLDAAVQRPGNIRPVPVSPPPSEPEPAQSQTTTAAASTPTPTPAVATATAAPTSPPTPGGVAVSHRETAQAVPAVPREAGFPAQQANRVSQPLPEPVTPTDGSVTFTACGCEWKAGPDQATSWNEAQAWIENLGEGWHTPSPERLSALYAAGTPLPFPQLAAGDKKAFIWSQARDLWSAWGVGFGSGGVLCAPRTDRAGDVRALAVRTRSSTRTTESPRATSTPGTDRPAPGELGPDNAPDPAENENDAGEIFSACGLEWCAGPDRPMNFNEARTWINRLGEGWQIPSLGQLGKLLYAHVALPFPALAVKGSKPIVWSRELTPVVGKDAFAHYVDFDMIDEFPVPPTRYDVRNRTLAVRATGQVRTATQRMPIAPRPDGVDSVSLADAAATTAVVDEPMPANGEAPVVHPTFTACQCEWMAGPDTATDLNEAEAWIAGLGEGWQTPTTDQLQQLHETGRILPFPELEAVGRKPFVWSTVRDAHTAWGVGFGAGVVVAGARTERAGDLRAMAVRPSTSGPGTATGTGTTPALRSELPRRDAVTTVCPFEWTLGPDRATDFDEATVWIHDLGEGWRAPTTMQLQQLYESGVRLPFPELDVDGRKPFIWATGRDPLTAWGVGFGAGVVALGARNERSGDFRALAVRPR